uniref:Helitron helicase-like domain-containing protein n=1 Tax=Brassica oleracea var. oleracea TaxID=109376 RepID=A0A0D3AN35_BRAOL
MKPEANKNAKFSQLYIHDIENEVENRLSAFEKSGKLKRINELHPCYLPLQYPLIFPYGEDRFRLGIQNGYTKSTKTKKPNITMREFFSFRIQVRNAGSPVLLLSRHLLQQFLVEA